MRIIALSGPKGSGKDTIGRLLMDMYPGTRTVAFADPIKKKIQQFFELNSDDQEQYDLFKRTRISYQLPGYLTHTIEGRHLVREIGMLMRSYDPDQFTTYVRAQIMQYPDTLWVITDLRFDNEIAMLTEMNAKFVRVIRKHYEYDGHITEQPILSQDNCDYIINNNSNIEAMKFQLREMVESFWETE
jgi:energy-coupling factor transporter ATP-binding protein EcfA2